MLLKNKIKLPKFKMPVFKRPQFKMPEFKLPKFRKPTPREVLTSPWTALFTLALILSIRIADPVFVEKTRLNYFDTLILSKAPTENNIYTVNIDEDTITKYGQWPFNREIFAGFIEDLYKRNAGLVVFNVLMSEKDRQGGDGALAATLNEFPVVLPNLPIDGTS